MLHKSFVTTAIKPKIVSHWWYYWTASAAFWISKSWHLQRVSELVETPQKNNGYSVSPFINSKHTTAVQINIGLSNARQYYHNGIISCRRYHVTMLLTNQHTMWRMDIGQKVITSLQISHNLTAVRKMCGNWTKFVKKSCWVKLFITNFTLWAMAVFRNIMDAVHARLLYF